MSRALAVAAFGCAALACAVSSASAREVTAWTAPCSDAACRDVAEWVGAFNLASFLSTREPGRNETGSPLAAVASSFGRPSAVLGAFRRSADFALTREWRGDRLKRKFVFPRQPIGDAAHALAGTLLAVVEFKDADGDGRLGGNDTVLSDYAFGTRAHFWQKQQLATHNATGGHHVHSVVMTTTDGKVQVEFGIADGDDVTHNGRSYDSHSMRMDVTVRSYPFEAPTGARSKLAIQFALMGTYAAASRPEAARWGAESGTAMAIGDYGEVGWDDAAFVEGPGGGSPRLAAPARFSGPHEFLESALLFSAANLVLEDARPSQIRNVTVAVDRNRPQYVQVGLRLALADVPPGEDQGLAIILVTLALVAIIVVGSVSAYYVKRRHKRWARAYQRKRAARAGASTPARRLLGDVPVDEFGAPAIADAERP